MSGIPAGGLLLLALLLCACQTPESRIRKNQEKFAAYPPQAQDMIRAGKVEVGFTQEMVLMALGKPSRKYTRKAQDEILEVWAYTEGRPGLGLSLGAATGSSVVYGGGISVGGGDREDERMRVVFKEGKVTAVEKREK